MLESGWHVSWKGATFRGPEAPSGDVKLINIDVELPLPDLASSSVGERWVLVRLHGHSLGILRLDASRSYSSSDLGRLIADRFSWPILEHLVQDGLAANDLSSVASAMASLPKQCPQIDDRIDWPIATVAVCTRDRGEQIADCLDALQSLDYPADRVDILIVDNAPRDGLTQQVVKARGDRFRYVCEPRPGLNWARNRAVLDARGEIVVFTDDDVSVDPGWLRAIATTFRNEPDAMCVTGLVVPDELATRPQLLFETYGGFGRGFVRTYTRVDAGDRTPVSTRHGGTGKFGTGANMAFRRSVFETIGLFDPALDVGTVTNGGGDLEMFFRVVKHGHLLVYEPRAVVRHRHRRSHAGLRRQLANNGIGFYAYLFKAASAYREERAAVIRLGLWWLWYWNLRRLLASLRHPRAFPLDLIVAEAGGSLVGPWRYPRARRRMRGIVSAHGPQQPSAIGAGM